MYRELQTLKSCISIISNRYENVYSPANLFSSITPSRDLPRISISEHSYEQGKSRSSVAKPVERTMEGGEKAITDICLVVDRERTPPNYIPVRIRGV